MHAAVYSGTRNIYEKMMTASKSLLRYSDVDKIYFLIEDDIFPYDLPDIYECINVSNQSWFKTDGPNYNTGWSYMILLKTAFTKLFPDLDKILALDVDTIVVNNISKLWELDLNNYYMAAVEEDLPPTDLPICQPYVNIGVALFNLNKMRDDKIDDKLIDAINTYYYNYPEQDCINEILYDKIYLLPAEYNICPYVTHQPKKEYIYHFAGVPKKYLRPEFKYYQGLDFDTIWRNTPEKIDLDIIIPTYKNKEKLRTTLDSIVYEYNVHVYVIDDASGLNYDDILNDYPFITLYQLPVNVGPGMARQFGIEHSNGEYIFFLDAGNYFYPNGLKTILKTIEENSYIQVYSYSYVLDDNNTLRDEFGYKTTGTFFKRKFINTYNIHFNAKGSYANEDYCFSRASKIITKYNLNQYSIIKHIYTPLVYENIDNNSITRKNNNEYFYTKFSEGMIINSQAALEIVLKNDSLKNLIKNEIIIDEYNNLLMLEYYILIRTANENPQFLEDVYQNIYQFYHSVYYPYKKMAHQSLKLTYYPMIINKIKKESKIHPNKVKLNLNQFLEELETQQFCPQHYYI